jgi:hypothetical protein
MQQKATIVGYPAQDAFDQLALQMLQQLLGPNGHQMEIVSAAALAGETMARLQEAPPAVFVISALPPGGLARAGYLCKRVRAHCPSAKILAGRWGVTEEIANLRERLRSAGADAVATSLVEARGQIDTLVRNWLQEKHELPVESASAGKG